MMIPVPAALVVQRDDEQVSALEILERGLASRGTGHEVAEARREAIEHRGREEKGVGWLGLARQHLLDQEVEDVAVAPGEGLDQAGGAARPLSLQRERRELQAGDPALGPLDQRRALVLGQLEAHDVAEERLPFVPPKAQVGGADLEQIVGRSKPRQRKWGVRARGDRDSHSLGQAGQEEADDRVDGGRSDEVVVVEHEDEIVRGLGEVVRECGDDHLRRRGIGRVEEVERGAPERVVPPSAARR